MTISESAAKIGVMSRPTLNQAMQRTAKNARLTFCVFAVELSLRRRLERARGR